MHPFNLVNILRCASGFGLREWSEYHPLGEASHQSKTQENVNLVEHIFKVILIIKRKLQATLFVFFLPLQICDKEWHYYVINVEFPAVTLFVDGVTYEPYLVTDDWPIHASKIDTQLTVGACWQGQCLCSRVARKTHTDPHTLSQLL